MSMKSVNDGKTKLVDDITRLTTAVSSVNRQFSKSNTDLHGYRLLWKTSRLK